MHKKRKTFQGKKFRKRSFKRKKRKKRVMTLAEPNYTDVGPTTPSRGYALR
jgi:hypothetical protein